MPMEMQKIYDGYWVRIFIVIHTKIKKWLIQIYFQG